ncbi:hypothetical protein AV530_011873 [Patagioenas fasciata monilis]|uniref:Uncharacterized protein n=1 Tax=Patagioenas fasciata monilis TaxID=372326 RepID=A0A1V4JU30_PATFA|nr:hypothetical protein AV530_011873 [Patagioenas fasciata monilis]
MDIRSSRTEEDAKVAEVVAVGLCKDGQVAQILLNIPQLLILSQKASVELDHFSQDSSGGMRTPVPSAEAFRWFF